MSKTDNEEIPKKVAVKKKRGRKPKIKKHKKQ